MGIKFKRVILPLVLGVFVISIILSVAFVPATAESDIIEVSNFQDLYFVVEESRANDFLNRKIVLTDDINITENDMNILKANGLKSLTIGSSDVPFRGEFDGAGYKISGLTCDISETNAYSDTGLFAYTENAIIRNVVIENANIDTDYRGGIIVGKAINTRFENISIKDSYMRVSCYNNALTLVTDAGLTGGGIVGEAEACVLYNCETINTRINNNNTSGVQALGGKGLYLGGLVGTADEGTTIEYSRVVDGEVKSEYDVAVGALGGNTLYVGGIVGEMRKGSKVIDCFATNRLYYYCATYVSVGAGNGGHIGGIAAAMYGSSCEIIRCHYAGEPSSKQYNAVLVIPIIQKNINLSGICNKFSGGSVSDCYYKESVTGSINTLGSSATTSKYGPQSDERYSNPSFWIEHDYDFTGNRARSSDYSDKHFNKWVMDYEKGHPVHGLSMSATLDFQGAGKVSIHKSELVNKAVSTTDPYNFAIQAINFNEKNITISTDLNEGYRFVSWYKVPNVLASSLPEDHSFFEDIIKDEKLFYSSQSIDTVDCEDNVLYVAHCQAQVLFHDINNNIIDLNGAVSEDVSDDWYDYSTLLPDVQPQNAPDSDTANLIGWTTDVGGYSAITSDKLSDIKERDAFYQANTPIVSTLSLYPVYADLISNVNVVFEGHEQDDIDNVTLRNGVGNASAFLNTNGVGVINVSGVGENGAFPDGYRFLGWYDENGVCVGRDKEHVLEGIDLTVQHTYIARFEYRVDYYSDTKEDIDDFDGSPFAQVWHKYNEIVTYLENVHLDGQDSFEGWYYGGQSDGCDCGNIVNKTDVVVAPLVVHAHIDGSSNYDIIVKSDFPGAAVVTNGGNPGSGGKFWVNAETNEGYNFLFWGAEGSNRTSDIGDPKSEWTETSYSNNYKPAGSAYSTLRWYGFEAHLSADVVFHFKNADSEPVTVTRHYLENVFLNADVTHNYQYPLFGGTISGITDVSAASPSNMDVSGYYFAGWLDKNSITPAEWDNIYGTSGGTYGINESKLYECSSLGTASAYAISDTTVVTEPMDLYPIYVKVDIKTGTNIPRENMPSDVNVPDNPTYSYVIDENGKGSVTVIADVDTYIQGDSGEKYEVAYITVQEDDGQIIKLTPLTDGKITYDIKAGHHYEFIAYYRPLIVLYHLDDSATSVYSRNRGDLLGDAPLPTYDLKTVVDGSNGKTNVFIGWTETNNSNGFHVFDDYNSFVSSDIKLVSETQIVLESMELWPVYAAISVTINSNIDDYLISQGIEPDSVRCFERPTAANLSLTTNAKPVEGYSFVGWYKDYVSLDNPGTPVAQNVEYNLENNEPFENVLYTAVYREAYEIIYYGIDGNIIYSVNVYEDDERSFIENVDGIDAPIDYAAFSNLQNVLPSNNEIISWRWNNDGTYVNWDDFCNIKVKTLMTENSTRVMHIYPVVRVMSAFDSTGSEMDCIGFGDDVEILLNRDDEYGYFARLNTEYSKPKLTVHIEDFYYSKEKTVRVPQKGIPVSLYPDLEMSKVIGEKATNSDGNAIFILFGELNIKKTVDDGRNEGNFVLNIARKENPAVNVVSVVVSVDEEITIQLPLGEYIITEDSAWAWRYKPISNEVVELSTRSFKDVVEIKNVNNDNKWFDSSSRNKNRYE